MQLAQSSYSCGKSADIDGPECSKVDWDLSGLYLMEAVHVPGKAVCMAEKAASSMSINDYFIRHLVISGANIVTSYLVKPRRLTVRPQLFDESSDSSPLPIALL